MCCSWEADSDIFWRKGESEIKIAFFKLSFYFAKMQNIVEKVLGCVLIYGCNEVQFFY